MQQHTLTHAAWQGELTGPPARSRNAVSSATLVPRTSHTHAHAPRREWQLAAAIANAQTVARTVEALAQAADAASLGLGE